MTDRRLPPCPSSPNCVSTESDDPSKRMPPLRFGDGATAAEVSAAIRAVLERTAGARVVSADAESIHAEFTTPLFRFVDDVDFLIDAEASVVHFRSASRVGHSDLGANRRRMRKLTKRLVAAARLTVSESNDVPSDTSARNPR